MGTKILFVAYYATKLNENLMMANMLSISNPLIILVAEFSGFIYSL